MATAGNRGYQGGRAILIPPLIDTQTTGLGRTTMMGLPFFIFWGGNQPLKKRICSLLLPLFLGCILAPGVVRAQVPISLYAIVGAKIEIGDGRVIDKGTIVIRDGRIEAVGKDITPPPTAEIVKGDGLVVYPGFIDAWSSAGLKYPDAQPTQDEPIDPNTTPQIAMRLANRKGVRPELRASDTLSLSSSQANDLRKQGFTTQWIVPSGGMINGYGTVVNLSGHVKRDIVVLPVAGAGLGFQSGGGGGFPGSLMGIFSLLRQTLLDGQRYPALIAAYDKGLSRRPPADDTLNALQLLLKGSVPALFEADTEREIVRVAAFSEEFRLRPIVVGGLDAYQQAKLLASKKIPVLLSLNFGKEASTTPAPDDDTPKAVIADRKRIWEERVGNTLALSKEGVLFAFTTRGLKSPADFWENLRRVIKAGLPRETALRALSLNAAQILGQERRMGTIEEGKSALLTIMNGDFADTKSKTVILFIDGEKFETDKEKPVVVPTAPRRRPRTDDDEETK